MFGASPVEDTSYAKSLYRAMIPLGFRWVGLATTRIAEDPELLKLAAESGCKGLLIGFESISQSSLDETRKGFHQARNYQEIVQKLHDQGFYVRDNIDGKWGPRTSDAVRNYQRAKGVQPSGQLDPATLAALDLAPSAEAAPPVVQATAPNPPSVPAWAPPQQ